MKEMDWAKMVSIYFNLFQMVQSGGDSNGFNGRIQTLSRDVLIHGDF
jgi:uncharacterized protein YihD (DUF1040 family)